MLSRMQPELEDFYEDILGKSMRGLGLDPKSLQEQSGLSQSAIEQALQGHYEEDTANTLAPILGLHPKALREAGKKSWKPAPISLAGLAQCNTPFGDMRVNAYVLWDVESKEAILFDTGAEATPLLAILQQHQLKPRYLLITHAHADHVAALDEVRKAFPQITVVAPPQSGIDAAESCPEGWRFQIGSLHGEALHTPGHSADGTTFVVQGLEHPVAVVGDAVFAGSMGGAPNAWKSALAVNREKIFTLPPETILCPGHGPMTTVAEESQHNPFYATA